MEFVVYFNVYSVINRYFRPFNNDDLLLNPYNEALLLLEIWRDLKTIQKAISYHQASLLLSV